jgi:hypothetical protein
MRKLCVAAGLLAACMFFARATEAASFTFSFVGELTSCAGENCIAVDSKWVVGSFTLNDPPDPSPAVTYDYQVGDYSGSVAGYADTAWSAKIVDDPNDPDALDHPLLNVGSPGGVFGSSDLFPTSGTQPPTVAPTASFFAGSSNSLEITLSWPTELFLSLSAFPPYEPGGSMAGRLYIDGGRSVYSFGVSSYTTAMTPIPAALPLFLIAIAGLGTVARCNRRRKAAAGPVMP